jgi:nitric oxide reductase NorD protein
VSQLAELDHPRLAQPVTDAPNQGRLVEPKRVARFALLASVVAGRQVAVTDGAPAEKTWTDGFTIFVDGALDSADAACSVVAQAALLGAGSLSGDHMDRLARRPALVSRFLAVEVHRALAAHAHFLPLTFQDLIDHWTAETTDSPAGSLERAEGRSELSDLPRKFGTIRPRDIRPDLATQGTGMAGPMATASAAELSDLGALDDEDDSTPSLDLDQMSVGGGGSVGKLLQRMLMSAKGGSGESGGPPGTDTPTRWSRRPRAGRGAFVRGAGLIVPDGIGVNGPRRLTYPEWDTHQGRYRADWCTVTDRPSDSIVPGPAVELDTWRLRRALSCLGADRVRSRRQMQGDELDVDAVVEARVQMRAGQAPNEAIFLDDLRKRHDLSVLILLDASGSAAEASTTGGTVHDHQRRAAAALAVTLHELGNRVALSAFRSQGRSNVEVQTIKRFDEPMDGRVLRRLGGVKPGAYTRLGAAIRHGSATLNSGGKTTRQLLVVISDGFAYDHGYEGDYGEMDAQRALSEARALGIGCLCLTIGASTDDGTLTRVFGTAAQGSIDQVDDLAPVAARLVKTALATASSGKRRT